MVIFRWGLVNMYEGFWRWYIIIFGIVFGGWIAKKGIRFNAPFKIKDFQI